MHRRVWSRRIIIISGDDNSHGLYRRLCSDWFRQISMQNQRASRIPFGRSDHQSQVSTRYLADGRAPSRPKLVTRRSHIDLEPSRTKSNQLKTRPRSSSSSSSSSKDGDAIESFRIPPAECGASATGRDGAGQKNTSTRRSSVSLSIVTLATICLTARRCHRHASYCHASWPGGTTVSPKSAIFLVHPCMHRLLMLTAVAELPDTEGCLLRGFTASVSGRVRRLYAAERVVRCRRQIAGQRHAPWRLVMLDERRPLRRMAFCDDR